MSSVAARSICLLLAATLVGASLLAGDELRTAAELPLDSFDTYPAGSPPPHPWVVEGDSAAKGMSLSLTADAESPFVGNRVTGKGLAVKDASATAGSGVGVSYAFTPPPKADLYLGFDFRYDVASTGAGIDLICRLASDNGRGPTLRLGHGGRLTLEGATGGRQGLAPLAPATWYHLAMTVRDGQARIALLNINGVNVSIYKVTPKGDRPAVVKAVPLDLPDAATRLQFTSAAPDGATGGWMLDNVCTAGRVDASRGGWWPFDQRPLEELRSSPRKVFGYYYPIYTNAYNDQDPGLSWYTRTVLTPMSVIKRKADRRDAGAELLYRPLPRPPMPAGLSKDEVRLKATEEEVRLARQQGLDGLLVDFWAEPHPTNGQRHFISFSFALLDAARRTDPGFKVLPAVYAKKDSSPADYANSPVVKRIAKHPAALRLPDGRLVWSMWGTERRSVDWWRDVIAQTEANGHPIALVAQVNSWGKLKDLSDVCYGMAHWGPRTPIDFPWVKAVRPLTEKAVFPICMQDVRTRGCALWEAEGSATLRSLWQGAIEDGADWAFIYTLTDYSEQAQAPSTCIGFVPYDLNAYYIQWFKTGEQPGIVRDRLYYFHRRHHTDVDPGRGRKWRWRRERDKGEPRDEIELLAFLAKPGALRITIDGQTHEKEAPKGITSFKAPLSAGTAFVPEFSLLRNGQTVVTRKSRYAVTDRVEYPNLLYCAGVIASE